MKNFKQINQLLIVTKNDGKKICLKYLDKLNHLIPQIADNRKAAHFFLPHTHSNVQTWKSVEGFTQMLSANPLLHLQGHTQSLRDSLRDVRSLFLHYLTDKQRRSYCASRIILSMSSCLSISPMFPLLVFFRLLL